MTKSDNECYQWLDHFVLNLKLRTKKKDIGNFSELHYFSPIVKVKGNLTLFFSYRREEKFRLGSIELVKYPYE